MATAQDVKQQLQNLINLANTTTGKSDTNLTDGVDSLIDGYGKGGTDTSDATATASHILKSETAYVKGEKVTGEIETYGGVFECSTEMEGEEEVVKKITFTDRPSLYAFLEEKHGGVLRAFLTMSGVSTSGTLVRYVRNDTESVFYICNVQLNESFNGNNELLSVRVSGCSIRVNSTDVDFCMHEGIVAKNDGTLVLDSRDNTLRQTVPDSYWSALGAECTLLYTDM